jgi:hypothetical protein
MFRFNDLDKKELTDAIKDRYPDATHWDMLDGFMLIADSSYRIIARMNVTEVDDLMQEYQAAKGAA